MINKVLNSCIKISSILKIQRILAKMFCCGHYTKTLQTLHFWESLQKQLYFILNSMLCISGGMKLRMTDLYVYTP